MSTKERPADRGKRRGEKLLVELLDEGRRARIESGSSQADVGRALDLSASRVSVMERGKFVNVPFVVVAQFLSVTGLELSARAYPVGGGLRDAAQIQLLERFRSRLSPAIQCRTEVPIPIAGDLRAWDAVLYVGSVAIGVEAETRLRDFQAVDRRLMLKARDSAIESTILLVSGTRSNRAILRDAGSMLRANYPISSLDALASLEVGRRPLGSAIVIL